MQFSPLPILLSFFCLAGCAVPIEGSGSSTVSEAPAPKSTTRTRVSASFNRYRVLEDAFFEDATAMSADGVQAFLEESPYGRSWLADASSPEGRIADTIASLAREFGINPLVLLSRMQTEASLVAASSRPSSYLVDRAMGCGCPDGRRCEPRYLGLGNQLRCAATKLRELYDRSVDGSGWWRVGLGSETLDGYWIRPESHATASLYAYTPWVLEGSGGTWLAWKTARLFDEHAEARGHTRLFSPGEPDHCGRFTDVPPTHPGYSAVEAVFLSDFMTGCSATPRAFCPEDTLTRAQAAVVLANALALPLDRPRGIFSDAPATHWAATSIEALQREGIIAGCAADRFCPEQPMSRAATAVVLARISDLSPDSTELYADVPSSHWASGAINALSRRGHIVRCRPGEFCPNSPTRRWIFADWLSRVLMVPRPAPCG